MFNQFSEDPEASAWSDKSTDFLFNVMHSLISLNLDECCMVDPNLPLTQASPFRFCVRSHPNEAERLWEFVHPQSVKKDWAFEFDGEKKRVHSATEMKCLEYLVHFFNSDHRLLVCVIPGNPVAALNFPLKRVHSTHVVPPGTADNTGILQTLPAKIAAYQLWVGRMRTDYANSNLVILDSVKNMDLSDLKSLAVYPLKYKVEPEGDAGESYILVFVPAFRHKQENREELHCKAYRIGTLLYGSNNYVPGTNTCLDFIVYGYIFALPPVLIRADSSEPCLFRVCRSARRLNRESAKARLMESVTTFSMRPTRVLQSNSQFLVTHSATAGKFSLICC